MGIAAITFLNAELSPGINLVKELTNFDEAIKDADWIITGEGSLDDQTLSGKTISGVLSSAKDKDVKTAVFCGQVTLSEKELKNLGIYHSGAIINHAKNLEDALENTEYYLTELTNQFCKKIKGN